MIRLKDVCKSYNRGRGEVQALDKLSFEIGQGERVSLLGRSGSGKTTLLNLLAGLDRASAGELEVNKQDLVSCPSVELDRYRQQTVGVVFQQFRLVKHQTAFQNVALPLMFAGLSRAKRRERVLECLKLVGLEDRAGHRPTEMSGGEQQRVAVARAISSRPKLLLADEPTGNLDSRNAEQIMDLLITVQAEVETTLLLITHDENLAGQYTKRILRLSDGRLQQDTGLAMASEQSDLAS